MMMMIEKKHKYMRPSELRWLKVVAQVLLRLEQRIRGRTKGGVKVVRVRTRVI